MGTVSSNPGGISYSYNGTNSGTASFINGTAVVLTATASTGSTVAWTTCVGGVTSGNGTAQATCSYASLAGTVSAGQAVATFTEYFVQRVSGVTVYLPYMNLAAGYADVLANGDLLLAKAVTLPAITFDRPYAVEVKGGYDQFFGVVSGFTTITGPVSISGAAGAVTIQGVAIQ
jgi:hypothetical protein